MEDDKGKKMLPICEVCECILNYSLVNLRVNCIFIVVSSYT